MSKEDRWKVPTDWDAYMRRPRCRMRDSGGEWEEGILYAVEDNGPRFFVKRDDGVYQHYDYCEVQERRPSRGMLVLSRKTDETILIGDDIEIVLGTISGNRVALKVKAPENIRIMRGELAERYNNNANGQLPQGLPKRQQDNAQYVHQESV